MRFLTGWTPDLAVREIGRRVKRRMTWLPYEQRFRFREIEKGKCYRCSQPTAESLEYFTLRYHIRSLVILLENPRQYELEYARRCSMKVLHIPISARPPTDKEIESFLDFVQNPENQPALIHCLAGKDRTGCFSFFYRVEHMGWDVCRAWNEMRRLGHCAFPGESSCYRDYLEKRYHTEIW